MPAYKRVEIPIATPTQTARGFVRARMIRSTLLCNREDRKYPIYTPPRNVSGMLFFHAVWIGILSWLMFGVGLYIVAIPGFLFVLFLIICFFDSFRSP